MTKLCDLLGIQYPIIQAAMGWITDARLVSAVSEAGGLGTLGPNAGATTVTSDVEETAERLRQQIQTVKRLTDKPFAVNFPVGFDADRKFSDRCIDIGVEEAVPVAIVSEGSPSIYTNKLKRRGIKVLHVVATARHARMAEEAGVDAVVTSGTEGGGHSGWQQVTTFVQVPVIADAVTIPVVAGGGVGDGRGLIAALALGASGVYVGTRFIATRECPAHPNVKQALLDADETGTISIGHGPGRHLGPAARTKAVETPAKCEPFHPGERRGSLRLLANEFTARIVDLEAGGASVEEVQSFITRPAPGRENVGRSTGALLYGDIVNCSFGAMQVVGLINDIPTCRELIDRMVAEAEAARDGLSRTEFQQRDGTEVGQRSQR